MSAVDLQRLRRSTSHPAAASAPGRTPPSSPRAAGRRATQRRLSITSDRGRPWPWRTCGAGRRGLPAQTGRCLRRAWPSQGQALVPRQLLHGLHGGRELGVEVRRREVAIVGGDVRNRRAARFFTSTSTPDAALLALRLAMTAAYGHGASMASRRGCCDFSTPFAQPVCSDGAAMPGLRRRVIAVALAQEPRVRRVCVLGNVRARGPRLSLSAHARQTRGR